MSDGVRELGIGHDYAPEAQPSPLDAMLEQIATAIATPVFAGLVVAAVVVILGLHRLRGRGGGETSVAVGSGGGAARTAAFAEMRRRRQARSGAGAPEATQPPRSDAAL
jgi:hypothetical protein